MEAKNLRIGNFLTLPYRVKNELYENEIWAVKQYFKVEEIYKDNLCVLELDEESVDFVLKDVKPIPLTEEWLLKFGFYQEDINDSWNIDTKQDIFALDSCLEFINYEHSPLNYVHQLQNLFFAITGQELELKDES